jgi:hypothetical protein
VKTRRFITMLPPLTGVLAGVFFMTGPWTGETILFWVMTVMMLFTVLISHAFKEASDYYAARMREHERIALYLECGKITQDEADQRFLNNVMVQRSIFTKLADWYAGTQPPLVKEVEEYLRKAREHKTP